MATAAERLAIIDQALSDQPAGVVQVTIDNQTVRWDRKQLLQERQYWERKAQQESAGNSATFQTITLRNF